MADIEVVKFWVEGNPAPGGSKKAFRSYRTGKIIVQDDCDRNAAWRDTVAIEATRIMVGRKPMLGSLDALFIFYLPRPKGHFRTGKHAEKLKSDAPTHPTVKPDTTKLIRATEDALTGIVWWDDAQIVDQRAVKCYCEHNTKLLTPGVWVEVNEHVERPKQWQPTGSSSVFGMPGQDAHRIFHA